MTWECCIVLMSLNLSLKHQFCLRWLVKYIVNTSTELEDLMFCAQQDVEEDCIFDPTILDPSNFDKLIHSIHDYRCMVTGSNQQWILLSLGVSTWVFEVYSVKHQPLLSGFLRLKWKTAFNGKLLWPHIKIYCISLLVHLLLRVYCYYERYFVTCRTKQIPWIYGPFGPV